MSIAENLLPFVKDECRYIQSLKCLFKEYLNNYDIIDIDSLNNFISIGLLVICSKELREDLTLEETETISKFFQNLYISPISLYSIKDYETNNKIGQFVKNIIKESTRQYQYISDYKKQFLTHIQTTRIFPYSKIENDSSNMNGNVEDDDTDDSDDSNTYRRLRKKKERSKVHKMFTSPKKKEETLFLEFIHSDITERLNFLTEKKIHPKYHNSFDTMNDIYDYYNGDISLNINLVDSLIYNIKKKDRSPIAEVLPVIIDPSSNLAKCSISPFMYLLIKNLKNYENTHSLMDSLLNNHLINGERYNHLRIISYDDIISAPSADMILDKTQM